MDNDDIFSGMEDIFSKMPMKAYIFENSKLRPAKNYQEWAVWFNDAEKRRVDYTELPGNITISTVCLGLDHNFNDDGPPILFETMVFGGNFDQRGWRFATLGEAKNGHWTIVDCITRGEPPHVEYGERPFIEEFFEMLDESSEENDNEE